MTEKTSLSISKELRELLRGISDMQGITMEQVAHKAVVRFAETIAHNPISASARPYETLQPLLKATRNEMRARHKNASGRSIHMQKINQLHRQARKEERAENDQNPQRRQSIAPYTSIGDCPIIIDHGGGEPSELTRRRMIDISKPPFISN